MDFSFHVENKMRGGVATVTVADLDRKIDSVLEVKVEDVASLFLLQLDALLLAIYVYKRYCQRDGQAV